MADDADAGEDDLAGAPNMPSGPRRSTYTPPTGSVPTDGGGPGAGYDDDDLAAALADQMSRLAQSGQVPVAPAASPTVTAPLAGMPAPSGPPVQLPQTATGFPDPMTGLPTAPQRRSLSNVQLMDALGNQSSGDTLDAMTQLESQMQLRQREAEEYSNWERTMIGIGTPEAIRSVQEARPAFSDIAPPTASLPVIDLPPAPPVAPPAAQVAEVPAPAAFSFDQAPTGVPPSPTGPATGQLHDDLPAALAATLPAPEGLEPVEAPSPFDSLFAPPAPPPGVSAPDPVVYDLVEPGYVPPPPPPSVVGADPEPQFDEIDVETRQRVIGGVAAGAAGATAFDALLGGAEVPSAPLDYEQAPPLDAADPVFIEPVGLLDPEAGPLATGSIQIVAPAYEEEPAEDVDDTDRAFEDLLGPYPVTAEGDIILPPTTGSAPVQPLASPRVAGDEVVVLPEEPIAQRAFALETAGVEPTPLDHRVGRATRLFWLWFAANSSVVSVAFGGVLFSLGISLRQAIVAAFVGIAVSFLPLGLGTLAGKWSGQPTMVVSRATFGLVGNVVPALLAIVTRLFWGAVLLWIIGLATARILVGAELGGPFTETPLTLLAIAVAVILAMVVAIFGYHLFARIQLILTILSALLVVGLVGVTWPSVHVGTALMVGDGPWILVVTGVVLVFSFFGLIWATSSSDLARYQRPGSSGAASMLLAPFGAGLPAFALIAYGALLAASNPEVAKGLVSAPLDTIALMIPVWYPAPLLAATVISLLSGVILSIYSGGFALQSLGLRLPRAWASVIIGLLVFGLALLFTVTVTSVEPLFRDLATTLAVPVAAWAGIFAAEMIIRRRGFDSDSLLNRGGVYPAVRVVNFVMLFVITVIGFGLTTASVGWLDWEGYIFTALKVPLDGHLAQTDLGVLVALLLGVLTPLVAGVPSIRRQERLQS